MFYGREAELAKLNEMHGSGRFEFAVIYGRRRVGKTTLIREFIKNKKALFFTASESTATDNLLSLSRCIGGSNGAPVYGDYENAISAVFKAAEIERFVFVVDEFPYLAESYRGISSLFQIMIDLNRENTKLLLILCGSSMSFMENQVLGYQSPLYGRRTAQFKIIPFTFFESLPFFGSYNNEEKAVLYGATGGVPEYLNKVNHDKTVRRNIVDLFLTPSGHFFEEPSNLIKQELREPSTYNVIIEAIASGSSRLNEISTKCRIENNKCAKYLSSLISLGLVSREYPYGQANGKRSIYKLEDNMFRFWYRFVFPNQSAINSGYGDAVYENVVSGQLGAYMVLVFETICRQWFFAQAKKIFSKNVVNDTEALPFYIGGVGRWWGTNPATRKQEEIDIMSEYGGDALFAECKWTNSVVDIGVLNELKRKSRIFQYNKKYFFIFVKKTVSPNLREEHELNRVKIYTLDQLINS
ncbi:MAG: ATP-binding protein [Defluviitaleaceae bacterium]|nr:ATP-binding protein [Defluviitaleaceae bacterium]